MNPSYQHYATHDESEYPELWEGCVGAWAPCLGPSGTRLHDHTERANWGTLTNMDAATDWVVDRGQYALDFDGSNDYVDVPSSPAVNQPGPITLSAWFLSYANPSDNQGIAGKWRTATPTNGRQYVLGLGTSSRLFFGISSDGTFQSGNFATLSTSITSNIWNHATLVFSPGVSVRLYVNGLLASVLSTATTSLFQGSAPFNIGNQSNPAFQNLHFNGRIDDVKLWGRAISDNDQFVLFRLGRGGMYQPRRRRKAYFLGPTFNPAWARGSNVILQPAMGVG